MKSIATHSPSNVVACDELGPGGAHHAYQVLGQQGYIGRVQFQCGPRGEDGSVVGCFDDDLLAIVEDRMACFQAGPYASPANARALDGIAAARRALAERVAERAARGVLGKMQT